MQDVYGSAGNDVFTVEFVRGSNTTGLRNLLWKLNSVSCSRVALKINGELSREWEDAEDRREARAKDEFLRRQKELEKHRLTTEIIAQAVKDPNNSIYSDQELAEKLSLEHESMDYKISEYGVKWARRDLIKECHAKKETA